LGFYWILGFGYWDFLAMPTYPVHALTLRRWRRRETDRTYRVLTLEHGVLEVSVQGAAKISSKLAGHVEPFSEVKLLLARRSGPFRVAGALIQRHFTSNDPTPLVISESTNNNIVNNTIKES